MTAFSQDFDAETPGNPISGWSMISHNVVVTNSQSHSAPNSAHGDYTFSSSTAQKTNAVATGEIFSAYAMLTGSGTSQFSQIRAGNTHAFPRNYIQLGKAISDCTINANGNNLVTGIPFNTWVKIGFKDNGDGTATFYQNDVPIGTLANSSAETMSEIAILITQYGFIDDVGITGVGGGAYPFWYTSP